MSIKSLNTDFNLLPTPASGFTYIGNDLDGKFVIKLDTGEVVYPGGIDKLSELTDVSVSGMTLGEALVWDGSKWVNANVIPDMSNYYTSGQTDTLISTERSVRIEVDNSLSTLISYQTSLHTSDFISLSSSISGETSLRITNDNSLSSSISTISGQTLWSEIDLQTLLSNGEVLGMVGGVLDGVIVASVSGLSTEISQRTSADSSIVSSLGGYSLTGHTHSQYALSTGLSTEILDRISNDNSLSSLISTISGQTIDAYTKSQADVLLSGKSDTGHTHSQYALSSVLSSEISDRISSDNTKLSLSGGTITGGLNIHGDLFVSGTTFTIEAEHLLVEDNYLTLNYGEIGSGITRMDAGIIVDRGAYTDYQFIFDELTDTFRIGESGDTQAVATREDSPTNGGIGVWNSGLSMFITNTTPSIITQLSNQITGNTSNITSLSVGLSTEVISRTSADVSLSTSIIVPWVDINRSGFVDNTQTSISFNDSTLVFTLSGLTNWSYYRGGIKNTISGDKTITIPSATDTYYVYMNNNTGTLESGITSWSLTDQTIPICILKLNTALTPKYNLADERHTCLIDRREHLYLHTTRGTQFVSGGVLTGPNVNLANNLNTNATSCFGVSGTTIADEDLFVNLAELVRPNGSTTTGYTCFYRTNSTTWSWSSLVVPYMYGANNRILYDNGSGTMTEAPSTNNRWYNYYLLYTNFQGQSRFALFPGRGQFTSLLLAQAEDPRNFDFSGFPIVESVIAYQFSWEFNTAINNLGKVKLAATPKKVNVSTITSVGSGSATDHNSLAGLQGGTTNELYHLTNADYLIATGISSSLATEISSRISGDVSLSTSVNYISGFTAYSKTDLSGITDGYILVISGTTIGGINPSSISGSTGATYNDSELRTELSGETSARIAADQSLSTAITAIVVSGGTFTGGTISYLNTTGDVSIGGFLTKGRRLNGIAYSANLPASVGPAGNKMTISGNDKALVMGVLGNGAFTIYYPNDTTANIGTSQFANATGILYIQGNRITKLSNGKVDMYDLVNGVVDTTTYSGYTTGNANFIQNTTYNVDYLYNTNVYIPRHKEIGNSCYIRDTGNSGNYSTTGKIIKATWSLTGNTYTIDFLTSGGSFSAYLSGSTEVVRVIGSGMTMNTYYDGVLQSSSGLSSNWIAAGHTTSIDKTAFLEENSKYIIFGYWLNTNPLYITIYDKVLNTYTNKIVGSYTYQYGLCNTEPTAISEDDLYIMTSSSRIAINPITKNLTITALTPILGDYEQDMMFVNGTLFMLGAGYGPSMIWKYIPAATPITTYLTESIDSFQLATKLDYMVPISTLSTTLSTTISSIPATIQGAIFPFHVLQMIGITTDSYIPFDQGYRLKVYAATYLQDNITGANINAWNKHYCDIMMVGDNKIYINEDTAYSRARNINTSGITLHNISGNTFNFIETGITFRDIQFNHRDELISYRDTTNGVFKIYDCQTDSVIKSVTSGTSYTWIAAIDRTAYWAKTTGTTIEIRRISDDGLIQSKPLGVTFYTFNLMYNPYNYCIYMWQTSVNNNSSVVNIYTGKGIATLGSYAGVVAFYTENFIWISSDSNLANIWVYNKFNRLITKLPNTYQTESMSNGKYYVYGDANAGGYSKIMY